MTWEFDVIYLRSMRLGYHRSCAVPGVIIVIIDDISLVGAAEVQRVVKDHEEQYNLDLSRSNLSFVDGLAQHIQEQGGGRDDVSFAFVLGTRKGDPNCGVQSSFTPSRYFTARITLPLYWAFLTRYECCPPLKVTSF